MKIIQTQCTKEHIEYRLVFDLISGGVGYSFPCNESGNIGDLPPIAFINYRKCITKELPVKAARVETVRSKYTEPMIIECNHCQSHVILGRFTNTCESCETDYNGSGQELGSRETWGEETGESIQDILDIDSTSVEKLLK